jgi:hypothetical protein
MTGVVKLPAPSISKVAPEKFDVPALSKTAALLVFDERNVSQLEAEAFVGNNEKAVNAIIVQILEHDCIEPPKI